VAGWQWQWQVAVAVDGGVVGEKMEEIGPVLRELRVFGAWVAVGVDGWQWQKWQ
jgi:hypothetical protein